MMKPSAEKSQEAVATLAEAAASTDAMEPAKAEELAKTATANIPASNTEATEAVNNLATAATIPAPVSPVAASNAANIASAGITAPTTKITTAGGLASVGAPKTANVQYIRIQRVKTAPDGSNAINIAEIQAFDSNGNLIQPASASYSDEGLSGFPTSNSIDGNMDNFAHTTDARDNFIQVSYSSPVQVSQIVITNRKDCCKDRMIGTHLQLFSKPGGTPDVADIPINDSKDVYTFTFNASQSNPWVASYIRNKRY